MMRLVRLIYNGDKDLVKEIIKKIVIPIDYQWLDYLLLMSIIKRDDEDISKFLLDIRSCFNENQISETPLDLAVKKWNLTRVDLILDKLNNTTIENSRYTSCLKKNRYYIAFMEHNKNIDLDRLLASISVMKHKSNIDIEKLIRLGVSLNKPIPTDSPFWPSYTPLHLSVYCQDCCSIDGLLRCGADLSAKNSEGMTALHLAAHLYDLPMMHFIMNCVKRYGIYVDSTDGRGFSHFHAACTTLDSTIVEEFLKLGVKINGQISRGSFAGYTPLHFAVSNNCIEIVKLLLKHGADISLKDDKGDTPLHIAVKRKYRVISDLLMTSLFNCSKPANPIDAYGHSHFHLTCMRNNHWKIVLAFLERGENVHQSVWRNSRYWPLHTPLHIAVNYKCKDTVKLLLEHGADVNPSEGTPPLCLAVDDRQQFPDIDIIVMLLEKGANVNACTEDGITPLHIAARRGDIEIISLLIQHKANVNCVEKRGLRSPLHFAAASAKVAAVQLLLKKGANTDSIHNGKNALHDMTSLEISQDKFDMKLAKSYSMIITYFQDAGCDINALDSTGLSPLYHATLHSCASAVFALLEHGAIVNFAVSDPRENLIFDQRLSVSIENKVTFILHEEKMRIFKLFVNNKESVFEFCVDPFHRNRIQAYVHELNRMRDIQIDSYSSLYDIIFKSPTVMVPYVLNESFKKLISVEHVQLHGFEGPLFPDRCTFNKSFPFYGHLIRQQFRNGVSRLGFLGPAKNALQTLSSLNLPDYCCDCIINYLTNQELINLISATAKSD